MPPGTMRSPSKPHKTIPSKPVLALAISVVAPLACVSATGCTGTKGQPAAQSPERQSDAEYDLAVDLFKKNNPRSALDHARKSVELNEENDKASYLVALILLSFCTGPRGFEQPDCKLAEIEKSARQSLKVAPQNREARNFLGQTLINEKKFKEAITVLEPLTKDPAYSTPHLAWGNLGWAQVEDGQIDRGLESLRNAVAAEPRFCVGHYHMGLALERKGDIAGAERSLTSAVTADKDCETLQDGWEARARVRARLMKIEDAKKDYERCVELSKETATGKKCAVELKKLSAVNGRTDTRQT